MTNSYIPLFLCSAGVNARDAGEPEAFWISDSVVDDRKARICGDHKISVNLEIEDTQCLLATCYRKLQWQMCGYH